MIYVMSDVHGHADAFVKMLNKISFSTNDELYIIGDIVDRGPNFVDIFNYIQKNTNVHLLMGNHEKMMMDFINAKSAAETTDYRFIRNRWVRWASNGGEATYDQYLGLDKEKQAQIKDVFNALPYHAIIEVNNKKYILCHAGIAFNKDWTIEKCIKKNIETENIIWMRDKNANYIPEPYIMIHGHTPVQYFFNTNDVAKYCDDRKIDIDCGCAYGYRLGCLRLDDMKEFYVDINEGL